MRAATTMTWEEFLAAGKEGQLWEWVDGEVEFMSSVNLRYERFLVFLITYLGQFCRTHPEWECFASKGVFTMASGNWRMPDASLVRKKCGSRKGRFLPKPISHRRGLRDSLPER